MPEFAFIALLFVVSSVALTFAFFWARGLFTAQLKRHVAVQKWQIGRLNAELKKRDEQIVGLVAQVEGFDARLALVTPPDKGKLLTATTPWARMENRFIEEAKQDKLATVGGLGPEKV